MRKSFFSYTPGMNTGIEDKINIDGYYVATDKQYADYGMVFYPDGTHGSFFFKNHDSLSLPQDALVDLTQEAMITKNGFYDGGGTYRISGDTIETDDYIGFCPNIYEVFYKEKFKIIDRDHIYLFQTTGISYDGKEASTGDRGTMYMFVPVRKQLPETGLSSKKAKWFWKNKEDWKEYVKAMRREKKLMKQNRKGVFQRERGVKDETD